MAFCTVADLLLFLPTLRLGGSTEATSAQLTHMIENTAADIQTVTNRLGYDTTTLDTCQAQLLRLVNCIGSAQALILSRGNEVDLAYIALLKRQMRLFEYPMKALKSNALDVAFLGIDYTLPLDVTRPSFATIAFTGSGTGTLTVTNSYNGTVSATFDVEIVTPTTFRWRKDGGAFSLPITITGTTQALSDSVSVTLSTMGHMALDTWTIDITVTSDAQDVQSIFPVLFDDIGVSVTPLDFYLDLAAAFVKTLAANRGYRLTDLNQDEAYSFGRCVTTFAAAITAIVIDCVTRQGRISDTTDYVVADAIATLDSLRYGRYDDLHRTISEYA